MIMYSTSVLKAKLKRGKISNFDNTHLLEEDLTEANKTALLKLFFDDDEDIILFYSKTKDYNWVLTNKRLLFPFNSKYLLLEDIRSVKVDDVLKNPNNKLTNNEVEIIMDTQKSHKIIVEEESWPIIYNLFRFIASKNTGDGNSSN